MWLQFELNQVKDLFLVLPDGEDNELKGFSWYRFGNSRNYRDLQSMCVQDNHSRKSLPSQQLLTTSVSLRKKKKRCLVPSECLHFRRDCQKAQSLKGLLCVIMPALKLQIISDDIQPGIFTVTSWWGLISDSWCLKHSVGAKVAKQPLLAFPLPCTLVVCC